MSKKNLFRTDVIKKAISDLDESREILQGVAVVTKGITHDERGEFDDDALDKVVELGNASKLGIKSRFGHPNMSCTALGTFLGRFKSFRRDGDIVRADLYLDPSAHNTPDGDLAQYVVDLSKSDPDAFGTSMVVKCSFISRDERGEDGAELEQEEDEEYQAPLIVVKELWAVDVVDDPAANNSFFGKRFFTNSVKISAEMTEFLDGFLNQPDGIEKAIEFLRRYQFNKKTDEYETSNDYTGKVKDPGANPSYFQKMLKNSSK